MIKNFFKDMPKWEDLNKKGEWNIVVIAIFPLKDSVVYSSVHNGRLWVAHMKVRLKALGKDIKTIGEDYGIGWYVSDKGGRIVSPKVDTENMSMH